MDVPAAPRTSIAQEVSVEGEKRMSLVGCLCRLYVLLRDDYDVINTLLSLQVQAPVEINTRPIT